MITTAISVYDLMAPQTLKTVEMSAKAIAKTDHFDLFMDLLIKSTDGLGDTEIGRRIIEVAPTLVTSLLRTPFSFFFYFFDRPTWIPRDRIGLAGALLHHAVVVYHELYSRSSR
jgi:hypothetical protein